jgi:hypothetical protein
MASQRHTPARGGLHPVRYLSGAWMTSINRLRKNPSRLPAPVLDADLSGMLYPAEFQRALVVDVP